MAALLVAFALGTSGHISKAAKNTERSQPVAKTAQRTPPATRSHNSVPSRGDHVALLEMNGKPASLEARGTHEAMELGSLAPEFPSGAASASRGRSVYKAPVVSLQLLTTPSFQPLGLGPGGVQSRAWDATADGSVVVGTFWAPNGFFTPPHAYRWTAGAFQDLGTLNPSAQEAEAYGVSDDGSKIVGWSRGGSGFQRPFLWTAAGGMQELFNVPGSDAKATDISHDGSVIVGSFYVDAEGSWHAFQWSNGAVIDLGRLSGGRDSKAQAVCGAGSAAVGSTVDSTGIQRAFRWQGGTMQNLGGVGKNSLAYAEDCSNDGSVVVGTSMDDKGNLLATRWDPTGIRSLGTLGGDMSESHASSADGSIVVGGAGLPFVNGISEFSAFRWSSASGKIEQLSQVLQNLGVMCNSAIKSLVRLALGSFTSHSAFRQTVASWWAML